MVSMKMGIDHPLDRLVRDLPYAIDEVLTVPRMFAGIDRANSLIGNEESRIRKS